MTRAELKALTPGLNWDDYFAVLGFPDITAVNVEQLLDFFKEADKVLTTVKMADWQVYLRFHLIDTVAPFLSDKFVDAHFAFRGTILMGKKENLPRWKRVINSATQLMGEAVGQEYVKTAFPPAAKAKALEMVNALRVSLNEQLQQAQWLSAATRAKAIAKLEAFTAKIGYPDKWRDYATPMIERGPFVLNAIQCVNFEHHRDLAKIGKPVDRAEWGMPPQMINAYYNPLMNEISLPGSDHATAAVRSGSAARHQPGGHRRHHRPRDGPRIR